MFCSIATDMEVEKKRNDEITKPLFQHFRMKIGIK